MPIGTSDGKFFDSMDMMFSDLSKAPMGVGSDLELPKGSLQGQVGAKKIGDFVDAAAVPGNMLSGKVSSGSQEEIEGAFNLAGFAVLGPAPVASKLADGTLGSFAGVRSRTADRSLLQLAQDAERFGFSPEDIQRSTGWGKGVEGRWKYEIDDSKASFNPTKLNKESKALLPDVLDHPELFKSYPELKEVDVWYNKSTRGASYDSSRNVISLGPDYVDKSTLMHEVQHAIQEIEGFAKGGMPGRANKDFILKYEADVDKLRPEFLALQSKEFQGDALSLKEESRLEYLREVFRKYADYSMAGSRQAYENYLALAGEVESRNVQKRLNFDALDRINKPPYNTQDIGDSKQIISLNPVATDPYMNPGKL